jgi:hypothetical protein
LAADTINQVVAGSFIKCIENYSICDLSTWLYPKFARGDATVPLMSSQRISGTLNYNAPNATVYECEAFGANNQNVDHTGMLSNPVVQGLLTGYLTQANGGAVVSPPDSLDCGAGGTTLAAQANAAARYHKLTLNGAHEIEVSDGTPDAFPDTVSHYRAGEDSAVLLLGGGKEYQITFRASEASLFVEWLYRDADKVQNAARFVDATPPAGAKARLTLRDGEISDLRYDSDNDGSLDKKLVPTALLTGKPARDLRPPKLKIEQVVQDGRNLISIAATDRGTGTEVIVYSTDGTHFKVYRGPFSVSADVEKIYAFADDAAGNRSKLFVLTRK